jgi:hypothetical protein
MYWTIAVDEEGIAVTLREVVVEFATYATDLLGQKPIIGLERLRRRTAQAVRTLLTKAYANKLNGLGEAPMKINRP